MAPVLLLVIATSAFAQRQTSQPPRELHRVGDHWTAYNPPDPATYPAGARTHTIVKGNTLWALAQQYYGNPYLWPQLWETNTWITDAHWIYPGDVLLVEGEGNNAAAAAGGETPLGQGDTFTATPTDDGSAVGRATPMGNAVALGTEADIYCYGYIGSPDEPMPNYVQSHEDYEVKYRPGVEGPEMAGSAAPGDLIFIHGDATTGLVAGETYLAVEAAEMVTHPATGAVIGRQYDYVGQIRILCTENGRSRAVVVEACREINIG
ncbi:MAG TPA: LysM peptidoglycan-binding domain-containing protein, partial [Thermoanaerobaculia bacterium]